jgi:hypothetical protein
MITKIYLHLCTFVLWMSIPFSIKDKMVITIFRISKLDLKEQFQLMTWLNTNNMNEHSMKIMLDNVSCLLCNGLLYWPVVVSSISFMSYNARENRCICSVLCISFFIGEPTHVWICIFFLFWFMKIFNTFYALKKAAGFKFLGHIPLLKC